MNYKCHHIVCLFLPENEKILDKIYILNHLNAMLHFLCEFSHWKLYLANYFLKHYIIIKMHIKFLFARKSFLIYKWGCGKKHLSSGFVVPAEKLLLCKAPSAATPCYFWTFPFIFPSMLGIWSLFIRVVGDFSPKRQDSHYIKGPLHLCWPATPRLSKSVTSRLYVTLWAPQWLAHWLLQ